jgi:hypothetical protein
LYLLLAVVIAASFAQCNLNAVLEMTGLTDWVVVHVVYIVVGFGPREDLGGREGTTQNLVGIKPLED